jgi:hypothetical protein
MTDQWRQAWRLRIREVRSDGRPGEVLGAGFVVARAMGMTCAHVVEGMTDCWIEAPDTQGETHRCKVRPADPGWSPSSHSSTDIALIEDTPGHLPVAPLGPRELPRVGRRLDALGYPARYATAGDRGQRTQVHVVGTDETGTLIQVDGLQGFDGQIQPGYSGGAAVDVASGRVVGMVVSADQARSATPLKIAWIIPLATLARSWSPLADMLPKGITVDPEFLGAVNDLYHCSYVPALQRLNALVTLYPTEPDMYYYRALAGLSGQRPGGYAAPMVEAVERLLSEALGLTPSLPQAHVRALWALVQEDYYIIRGIPVDPERLQGLQSAVGWVDPRHADEILRHVPAVECPTWQRLHTMRGLR